WIHGGGFLTGDHRLEGAVVIPFVRAVGCTVVSVGYRLAPEHRAPAASDDCYASLCWVASAAGEQALGFKPRKPALGGAPAGGGHRAGGARPRRTRDGLPAAARAGARQSARHAVEPRDRGHADVVPRAVAAGLGALCRSGFPEPCFARHRADARGIPRRPAA